MASRPHRPAPLPSGMPRILVSGYLTKRTKNFKSWKKRWWQLSTDGMLLYFKNESRCKVLREINIAGTCYDVCLGADKVKVSFPTTIPPNCCFSFSILKRTYYVYAATETEAKRWTECIAHVSGVLRRKREVQYKASFQIRRDAQPPLRGNADVTVRRIDKQSNRHSYTDSIQTDSQEDDDTVAELPVFGSDKGAMRYSSVPTRLDDLREVQPADNSQARPSHEASAIPLQNSLHMTTSPKFLTLQYERRSSPSKKISFSSSVEDFEAGHSHKAEGVTIKEGPSVTHRKGTFTSYAKDLEQLEKQEAEIRKKLKELDASTPPKRSASVLQLGKAKDEYAQAVALGMPILPSLVKQRSLGELSANSGAPPIMPKPILRNSGRRKAEPAATSLQNDAAASVLWKNPNAGDCTENSNHVGVPSPPASPPPPPLPPRPSALPPAPPCPPTPTLQPPTLSTAFPNTFSNTTTLSSSSATLSPSLVWQTSEYWGLNGTKTSSMRADDASRWARDEMKKVGLRIYYSRVLFVKKKNVYDVWLVSFRN